MPRATAKERRKTKIRGSKGITPTWKLFNSGNTTRTHEDGDGNRWL